MELLAPLSCQQHLTNKDRSCVATIYPVVGLALYRY